MTPFLDIAEIMGYIVEYLFYYEVTAWEDIGTFRLIDPIIASATLGMIIDICNYVVRGPASDR